MGHVAVEVFGFAAGAAKVVDRINIRLLRMSRARCRLEYRSMIRTLETLAVASHLEHNICSDVGRFLPLVSGSNGDSFLFLALLCLIWIEDGSQDPIGSKKPINPQEHQLSAYIHTQRCVCVLAKIWWIISQHLKSLNPRNLRNFYVNSSDSEIDPTQHVLQSHRACEIYTQKVESKCA